MLGFIVLLAPSLARAANDEDTTVVPLGSTGVERGSMERLFHLPEGPDGPMPQAIVFITSRPWTDAFVEPPAENAGQPTRKQVPATIKFTVAGKELPPWPL